MEKPNPEAALRQPPGKVGSGYAFSGRARAVADQNDSAGQLSSDM
jgi:hypothetical protein